MGYIVDFVQEQRDARLTEALVLRFHRMLTYSVPYRHNIRGRYRVRRGRRLYLLPPAGTPSSSPTITSAAVFGGSTPDPRTRSGIHPTRRKMSKSGRSVFGAH